MPEGLTPASLVTFDEHVERVIRDYTLRGVHVLAHCRGKLAPFSSRWPTLILRLVYCSWSRSSWTDSLCMGNQDGSHRTLARAGTALRQHASEQPAQPSVRSVAAGVRKRPRDVYGREGDLAHPPASQHQSYRNL